MTNNEEEVIIPIDQITDFPNHPYKVKNDEKMQSMVQSVKEMGVIYPVIVRKKDNGKYEMISGHRRKMASVLAGKKEIKCIVKNLTDDEATILMVDSNIQREEILPSEKAYSYKMKLDAIKHQGRKIEETSNQLGGKNNESAQLLGEDQGDSGTQVRRYIRLTKLIPEILEKVDEKRIAFNPAVEISYLTQEEQTKLYDAMECNDATPSLGQAIHLKKLSQAGMLTQEDIDNTMSQIKPNQIPKIKFNDERIRKILPKSLTEEKIEDYVVEAISFYNKYLKQRKREAR